jgi:membrane-associated phospholipid phosphatase
MRILTDFTDQAVVLPLIATIGLMLGVLGWRRGALVWLVSAGCSFASVLVLKLVFATCGPALGLAGLRSPSGHTAAAAVIAGGIAVTVGWGRGYVAGVALLAALLIGVTRVALGLHTAAEAALGGALGVLGVLGFALLAGRPPTLRLRWLFAAMVAVALLLHGLHLDVEQQIRAMAFSMSFCR